MQAWLVSGWGLLLVTASSFAADAPRSARCEQLRQASAGCLPVPVPAPIAKHVMADHGAQAGDAFDLDGNPIDRHDNIVAVPEQRPREREVFTSPAWWKAPR